MKIKTMDEAGSCLRMFEGTDKDLDTIFAVIYDLGSKESPDHIVSQL
jgi:hypothetical protein